MNEKLGRIGINVLLAALISLSVSCNEKTTEKEIGNHQNKLPYWGESDVAFRQDENGATIADTVYYSIPKFSFINQDSAEVSHRTYAGKIFVADFFFTTCPTICPTLSAQMARVQTEIRNMGLSDQVWLLSHTVDPLNDSPAVLKAYGDNLGVDYSNWNFVTGKAEDIYYQAEDGYMLTAFPSDTAQGGFFHTDKLSLIDGEMHIRGYYDGTSTKEVNQLLEDIKLLAEEQKSNKK